MKKEYMDTRGLRCPLTVLKIANRSGTMKPGDILEVHGDCPTLERDVREWCDRSGHTLFSMSHIRSHIENDKIIRIQI